jgi:threonine dehydratase
MGGSDLAAADVVTRVDVEAARERIADVVHRTPLDTSRTFAGMSGAASVGLKLEAMQRTGSFKIRGAYNRLSQLSPSERANGVVASSAGNHAQGVALAGQLLDVDTTIVVPEITPAAKIDATRGYGADVIVDGEQYEGSYERALDIADGEDREFVHPFDDAAIIAGQGTVGCELLEQLPDLDTVVVAVGGGGLISGIATALKAHDPGIRVVGVQPEGAAHAKPSLETGEIHRLSTVDTVAEGIADARLLEKTFAVARERVDDVVSVSDGELSAAVALTAERAKVVAEAAGVAPVAALFSENLDVDGETVAAVVSGGNVGLREHAELVRSGLLERDRYATVRLELRNWPTALGAVVDTIEECGAELDELARVRRDREDRPNRTPVELAVAGSGRGHLETVVESLDAIDGTTVCECSLRER